MMLEKTKFKKMIGDKFKAAGFVKKGQAWYLVGDDANVVCGLQKSDYADKYYINLGIWIKAFGGCDYPKDNVCHVQARFGSIFSSYRSLIDKACSLDEASNSDVDEFLDLVEKELIPFCQKCLTLDGIKALFLEGAFRGAFVYKRVRAILALPEA
jgi:hypothetical protein